MKATKLVRRRSSTPAPVPEPLPLRPGELPPELALERTLLGTLVLFPTETLRAVRGVVDARDFAAPYHEVIYRVACELDDAGRPVEWFALYEELQRRGEEHTLRAVGGPGYVDALSGAGTYVHHAAYCAEQVAALGYQRRIGYVASEIAARARARDCDPVAFAAEAVELFAEVVGRRNEAWPTAAELALRVGYNGPRLATGLAAVDEPTRGLARGKVVVLGGAPGAGKTQLSLQLARKWALEGHVVGFLASDQPAEDIVIRWGQLDGQLRADLEAGDPSARAELSERLAACSPLIVDGTADPVHVDAVSKQVRRIRERKGAAVSILVVDSLHTVEAGAPDDADQRARVEAATQAAKRAAKRDGHVVVATCELVKASYRSKVATEQVDDRAAFADSRAVLHAADLALVLRTPLDGSTVEVSVAKSRIGRVQPFKMQSDWSRGSLAELEAGPNEERDDEDTRRAAVLDALKVRILRVVKAAPEPIRTRGELVRRVAAKRVAVLDALDELLGRGEVEESERGFRIPAPPNP